jgi:hypothetical protein
MKSAWVIAAFTAVMLAFPGCDPLDRVLGSDAQRAALWDRVASRPDLTNGVIDRLMAADSTRARMFARVMESGPGRQDLLTRVGRDRSLMDGAIQYAVQDSSMRDHLMTLFRGMQMTEKR